MNPIGGTKFVNCTRAKSWMIARQIIYLTLLQLNGHGQYDLDSGLTSIKRFVGSDPVGYSRFERIARQCESGMNNILFL